MAQTTRPVRTEGGSSAVFVPHPVRRRFNAGFFTALDSCINWLTRDKKRQAFSELPPTVVEVGPGVGANFRYLPPSCHVIAIEPDPYMHRGLHKRAARYGIDVEIRSMVGDAIDLADQSADAVISSLLVCTVADPARVVGEIRRILRPGGRYAFLEHVGAADRAAHQVMRGDVQATTAGAPGLLLTP